MRNLDVYAKWWHHWIRDLHLVEQLSIPRCFRSSGFGNVTSSSLVLFSDAITVGYGIAAYLILHDGNKIHSSLFMEKSRVSLIKAINIPRLKLKTATVSVKVVRHILRWLECTIGGVVYFTDSRTVVHSINANTKSSLFCCSIESEL
ncbi:uncharacterized protein [Palaemon carinicauda]|uniref:uncharacterized protein n=1 Tax=Palaemon carinicauda TaxID=392227 RepID=UPI0035B5E895